MEPMDFEGKKEALLSRLKTGPWNIAHECEQFRGCS